jgi:hypothetical protein
VKQRDKSAPGMGKLLLVTAVCAIAVATFVWLALVFTNLIPSGAHPQHRREEEEPPRSQQLVLMDVGSTSPDGETSESLDELLLYLKAQKSQQDVDASQNGCSPLAGS